MLASEQFRLLQESPDALRAVRVIHGAAFAKLNAGEAVEAYRLAQWCIDLVGGGPVKGRNAIVGSPLAVSLLYRGLAGYSLGRPDWRDDMRSAIAMQRSVDAHGVMLPLLITVAYARGILTGALLADDDAVQETAEAVRLAEERGDDVALELAHGAQGLVLSRRPTAAERDLALEVLRRARDAQVGQRNLVAATGADIRIAELTAEGGEVQGAIESARSIVDQLFETGEMSLRGVATAALVESLLCRGSDTDVQEAAAAIERLAAVPTDPGFVLNEIPLLRLRALLAAPPTATTPPTATIGIATARWPPSWASRGTWRWLRRCHDGGGSFGGGDVSVHRCRGVDPSVGGRRRWDAVGAGRP